MKSRNIGLGQIKFVLDDKRALKDGLDATLPINPPVSKPAAEDIDDQLVSLTKNGQIKV